MPVKKIAAILLLIFARPAWSAIAFVQAKDCHVTTGNSMDCLFDAAPAAHNLFVVGCAGNSSTANLVVTDDQGDVFTLVGGTVTTGAPSGTNLSWGIWYSSNVKGDFTTIHCQDMYANVTWLEGSIHEYSGAAITVDPFDVASSSSSIGSRSTDTVVSGYASLGYNNELVFGFAPKLPAAATSGSGTLRVIGLDNANWASEDAIVPVATVYQSSVGFALNGTDNWMSQAGFRVDPPPLAGTHTWQ